MKSLPDHYQVKYRHKGSKENWKYGIFDRFGAEAEGYWKRGQCIIADAVLPLSTLYNYDELEIVDIELGMPSYDFKTNTFTPGDEYGEYVQKEYKKAKEKSKKAKGLANKLFSVGVADGKAYYVVVKENKKTCRVQWRGFGLDRYTDAILGWECTVEKERIADRVKAEEGLAALFAGKSF
jgi:hypothetical protein